MVALPVGHFIAFYLFGRTIRPLPTDFLFPIQNFQLPPLLRPLLYRHEHNNHPLFTSHVLPPPTPLSLAPQPLNCLFSSSAILFDPIHRKDAYQLFSHVNHAINLCSHNVCTDLLCYYDTHPPCYSLHILLNLASFLRLSLLEHCASC